jgi:hypothetical protein
MFRTVPTPGRALLACAVLAAVVAAALTAAPSQAAPKPGFLPGIWIGNGTITGFAQDGPMATHFSGGIRFKLTVSNKLKASGTGTWKMNMLGSEDGPSQSAVDSSLVGSAAVRLAGGATNVTFAGAQHIVGEVRMGALKQPMRFDRPLNLRLAITRAGRCKVTGSTTIQPGVTLKWSAQLKGSGTCNA